MSSVYHLAGRSTPRLLDRAWAQRGGWLLAVYCGVVFFWKLGAAPLIDVDEGAFSEATREMLAGGDWLTTHLNGALRFDKPILTYWLQALPVSIFGPQEWAFRLPSALAACGWAWLLHRFASRHAREAAPMATFMLASALGPLLIARAATADALLNCFIAGSLFSLYSHLHEGRRRDLVAAFAWIGLGVLTKGPIAIAVPALAVAAYCASRGEWLRPFTLLRDPVAWLAFAVIALPWYALELHAQGGRFIEGFFMKHNVHRFTTTMLGHGGRSWYYIAVLPLLVFPFLAPLAGALLQIRAAFRDDLQRFLWCSFASVFVFFSLSSTQLPHYLLYGMTPLFLLLALYRGRLQHPLAVVTPALAGMALLAASAPVAQRTRSGGGNELGRALLTDVIPVLQSFMWPALMAAAAIVAASLIATRAAPALRRDVQLYAAGGIPALLMVAVLWPTGVSWFQGPVVAAAEFARKTQATVVQWNANWPSFSVYRGEATPARPPFAGDLVLTRADRVHELPAAHVVFARREVVLARMPGAKATP